MARPIHLAPSVLSADFNQLGAQVAEAEAAGANRIHLDVMDGHFVPTISFGPLIVKAVSRVAKTPLEVHLMVEHPEWYLDDFVKAGSATLIVHQEAVVHLHRTLQKVRDLGNRAGLAFNPATPLHALEEIIEEVDLVLLMSVNPGYSGQKFIPNVLSRLERARELIEQRNPACDLEVDGGVDSVTGPQAARAGANVLVAASAVFNDPAGITAAMRNLRAAVA
jgi:ribulose-phosphate 3-epimerase